MGRLKKFVATQPEADLPDIPTVDFSKAGLEQDSDDYGKFTIDCQYLQTSLYQDLTYFIIINSVVIQKYKAIQHILDNGVSKEHISSKLLK